MYVINNIKTPLLKHPSRGEYRLRFNKHDSKENVYKYKYKAFHLKVTENKTHKKFSISFKRKMLFQKVWKGQ